jgi:hypothetical protein
MPALRDPERCFQEGRERKEQLPRPYGVDGWDYPDKEGIPELDLGKPAVDIEEDLEDFEITSKFFRSFHFS